MDGYHGYHRPEVSKVKPPGSTIETRLAVLGMSRDAFATAIGKRRKTVDEIIDGRRAITPELSRKINAVIGMGEEFWYRLDQNYRKAVEGK